MSYRINNNTTAMTALRNLGKTAMDFNKAITRLSTGLRINDASDDPSGLVASENMRAQIGGLDMAISNSSRATNMIKTAEGAMDEVQSLLKQMRSLAVQASNTGASDSTQLAANQAALDNALASIDRIAGSTRFGGIQLLDGSASQKATSTSASLSSASTTGTAALGTYRISVDTAGVKGSAAGQASQSTVMSSVDATIAAATSGAKLRLDDGAGNAFGMTQPIEVDISTATSLAEVVSAINSDTTANKFVTASASAGRLVVTTKNKAGSEFAGEFKVTALVNGAEDNTLAQSLGFTDQTGAAHMSGYASPISAQTRSVIAGSSTALSFSAGVVSLTFNSTTDFGNIDTTTVSLTAASLNDVAAAINGSDIGSKVIARVEQLTATNGRLVLDTKDGGTASNFSLTVNTAGGSGLATGTGAAAQTGRVEGAATARSFASTALTFTVGAAASVGNGAISVTTTTTSLDGLVSALNSDSEFSKFYTAKVDSVNDTMGKVVIETKREGVTLSQISIASGDAGTAAVTGVNATAAENIATGSMIDKRLSVSRLTGIGPSNLATPLTAADTISFADVNRGGVMGIGENVTVSLEGATSLQDVVNKINGNDTASKYVKASLTSDGRLQIDSVAAVSQDRATDLQVNTSTNLLARNLGITLSTTTTDVSFNGKAADATSSAAVMVDTQYTFKKQDSNGDLSSSVTFSIAKGTSIADAISKFAEFSARNGLGVSLNFLNTGQMTLSNDDTGTSRGVQVDVASGQVDALGIDRLFTGSGPMSTDFANKYARGHVGQDLAVSVNGKSVAIADINGSMVSISSASAELVAASGLSFKVAADGVTGEKGSVTVSGSGLNFQVGANAGESVTIQIQSVLSKSLGTGVVDGKSLADLNVTTFAGAQQAISIIDKALDQVSTQRAQLGSFQSNTLESNMRSLSIAKENLQAAESQIRDIDVASEMTNFTKLQILQQSGMAMLAQANQAPQGVLSLLRG